MASVKLICNSIDKLTLAACVSSGREPTKTSLRAGKGWVLASYGAGCRARRTESGIIMGRWLGRCRRVGCEALRLRGRALRIGLRGLAELVEWGTLFNAGGGSSFLTCCGRTCARRAVVSVRMLRRYIIGGHGGCMLVVTSRDSL